MLPKNKWPSGATFASFQRFGNVALTASSIKEPENDFEIDVDMDEDIKESVTLERNTIMEMFQRMSTVK
jgi:hypothetical protein